MRKYSKSQKTYFAPGEVAEMLMVSPASVRNWASKGALKSVSTPGGHRRFMRHEIERFAREKDLTIQPLDDDTLRILIVDDNTQVTEYLSLLFSRLDANVTTMKAHDGFTAGRLVQVFEPHVVLLDLMMPGLDGFNVCAQIKSDAASKATRVIAMTSFYDDVNVARALSAGAECCIEKPFDTDDLLILLGLQENAL
ncbi:MAG: response regulator [Gammaproteobacteria bacterium]|nr:response regulator [Gammaproteobacteria bacterium]